ncbi:MAG: hypothetical protein Q6373_008315 [Candidatus Sigynarchaeota archaeon]
MCRIHAVHAYIFLAKGKSWNRARPNLVEVCPGSGRAIGHDELVEAIYCAASPHHATLA